MERNDRLPEIVEYYRTHPTPRTDLGPAAGDGGQHIHIHHHYAPPAPPPAPPPGRTVAEQVVPWVWLTLGAMIVATICSLLLAAMMIALVVGLVALTLFAVALAFLIKTVRESQINAGLAQAATRPNGRRNR